MFSVANNALKKVLKAAYNANQQDLEPGALENKVQVNVPESIYITRAPTDTKFKFTHMVFLTESKYITYFLST